MNQEQMGIVLHQIGWSTGMALGIRQARVDGETLVTRIGRRHHMRIELTAWDLYNVQIFSVRGGKVNVKVELTDLYAEDLSKSLYTVADEIDGF